MVKRPNDTFHGRHSNRLFLIISVAIASSTFLLGTAILAWLLPPIQPTDILVQSGGPSCPFYGRVQSPRENETTIARRMGVEENAAAVFKNTTLPLGYLFTRQGPSHEVNQDRAFLIRPFQTMQTTNFHEDTFLLGILDGHGVQGHFVAEYAQRELPRIIAERLNQPCCGGGNATLAISFIQEQLQASFVQLNQNLPLLYAERGGCTASVTLRLGSTLFFANAGDSRTVLVKTKQLTTQLMSDKQLDEAVKVTYRTRLDKPHLPDEHSRITELGGKIHTPPKNPTMSRVVLFSRAARPPETIGLAMSRSIGDWEWKAIGVTASPIVDVMTVPLDSPSFVLAASDGLWDLRREEFIAKRFAAELYGRRNTTENLQELVDQISPKKGYRDDISFIIAPLRSHG